MKTISIPTDANICTNAAMRSVLSSTKNISRFTSLALSALTYRWVRGELKKPLIQNDCLLLKGAINIDTVLSDDEDKFNTEHNYNELYFKQKLITGNLKISVPLILKNIKKILSPNISDRQIEVYLSVQTERYPSVTVFIHTYRENFDCWGNIDDFKQPVLKFVF